MIKLSAYISSIVKERELNLEEVAQRGRGQISAGYIHDLMNEKAKNPSVSKLQALAKGLGVPEEELFRVARGLSIDSSESYNAEEVRMLDWYRRMTDDYKKGFDTFAEYLANLSEGRKDIPAHIEKRFQPPTKSGK